jgi:hypothetical protein
MLKTWMEMTNEQKKTVQQANERHTQHTRDGFGDKSKFGHLIHSLIPSASESSRLLTQSIYEDEDEETIDS